MNSSFQKKRKIDRACDYCRRRKSDDAQPPYNKCSSCISHEWSRRGRPSGYVKVLEQRIKILEGLIRKYLCPDQSVLHSLISPLDAVYAAYLTNLPISDSVPSTSTLNISLPIRPSAEKHLEAPRPIENKAITEKLETLATLKSEFKRLQGKGNKSCKDSEAAGFRHEIMQKKRPSSFWKSLPWYKGPTNLDAEFTFPPPDLMKKLADPTSITYKTYFLVDPPTLYDLQLYCVTGIQFLSGCCTQHTVWVLVGFAIRMAQEAGIHHRRVPREKLTVEDELWKRAFWVLIALDRVVSTGVGRPCSIFDDQFDLDMPVECDDEYWEHQDPSQRFKQPEGVPSTVTAFNQQLRLTKIMAFAMNTVGRSFYYSIKTKFWEYILQEWEEHIVAELDSALNNWITLLPDTLSGSLITIYYYVQIVVHRPYIRATGQPSPWPRSCCLVLEQQLKRFVTVYPHIRLASVASIIALFLSIVNIVVSKRSGIAIELVALRQIKTCMGILKKRKKDGTPFMGNFNDIINTEDTTSRRLDSVTSSSAQPYNVVTFSTESDAPAVRDSLVNTIELQNRFYASVPPQTGQQESYPQAGSFDGLEELYGFDPSTSQPDSFPPDITTLSSSFPIRDSQHRIDQQGPNHQTASLDGSGLQQGLLTLPPLDMDYASALRDNLFENYHTDYNVMKNMQQVRAAVDDRNTVGYAVAQNNNTMDMWLNAPNGFELDEWNTFFANFAEVTR
ncbi:fungal-specific transcription factor domain-containing protein [Cyathus striatus]|nr:fungal-specific transcription factor domain-containing protein [Cyathus striatus]